MELDSSNLAHRNGDFAERSVQHELVQSFNLARHTLGVAQSNEHNTFSIRSTHDRIRCWSVELEDNFCHGSLRNFEYDWLAFDLCQEIVVDDNVNFSVVVRHIYIQLNRCIGLRFRIAELDRFNCVLLFCFHG